MSKQIMASDIIKALQEAVDKHGDLPVDVVIDYFCGDYGEHNCEMEGRFTDWGAGILRVYLTKRKKTPIKIRLMAEEGSV